MRKRSEPHWFERRLAEHRSRVEAEAAMLPRGRERDAVMKRIEQLQTATEIDIWLSQGGEAFMKLMPARALGMMSE
jgi:hypothetical protein